MTVAEVWSALEHGDTHARLRQRRKRPARAMPGTAALANLRVLRIGTAEQHEEVCVSDDRRPGGQRPGYCLRATENMRQEGQRRAKAVIAHLVDEAATGREKAAQLGARFVKMTGR